MDKPKITIKNNQRILVIGAPNDGKTTLSLALLKQLAPKKLVVLNPGADESLYRVFGESTTHIQKPFPAMQHVAPMVRAKKQDYGEILWPIIQEGKVFTFIDELSVLADANQYSPALQYLYQQGRRRFCSMMALTQRAKNIPIFCFSFSEHIFVGRVEGPDLERLEKGTGKQWAHLIAKRHPHQFAYWSPLEQREPFFIN